MVSGGLWNTPSCVALRNQEEWLKEEGRDRETLPHFKSSHQAWATFTGSEPSVSKGKQGEAVGFGMPQGAG